MAWPLNLTLWKQIRSGATPAAALGFFSMMAFWMGGAGNEPSIWPDATNTGVPSGTVLTPAGDGDGNFFTSSNGQVVDALLVSNTIVINHNDVTVRNCQAKNISVEAGKTGAIIHHCTLINGGIGLNVGAHNAEMYRNDISGSENGIFIGNTTDDGSIHDNYIHDPHVVVGVTHSDGVQFDITCDGWNIEGNNVDFSMATDANSCMTMKGLTNSTFHHNRMSCGTSTSGGTYDMYIEDNCSGLVISNCEFDETFPTYVQGVTRGDQTYTANTDFDNNPLSKFDLTGL